MLWDTKTAAMGAIGHHGTLLWVLWAAMGHCYSPLWVLLATAGGGMGAMYTLGHYGLLLWVLRAAMCAMDHCYGYYGLLWTTAMGYYVCYGPLLWVL